MGDEILLLYKRLLLFGLLVITSLFLLSFILSTAKTDSSKVKAASSTTDPAGMSSSPNVITSGMATAANRLDKITGSATQTIGNGIKSVGSAAYDSGTFIVQNVGSGISFVGHATGTGITFVSGIPGDILGAALNDDVINTVIRPDHNEEVPIIDPNSPELQAALASLPPGAEAHPAADQTAGGPVWPIHGNITSEFGVYHRPYQRTHTGLDISDRQPAGTTPAKPFRPGRLPKRFTQSRV